MLAPTPGLPAVSHPWTLTGVTSHPQVSNFLYSNNTGKKPTLLNKLSLPHRVPQAGLHGVGLVGLLQVEYTLGFSETYA